MTVSFYFTMFCFASTLLTVIQVLLFQTSPRWCPQSQDKSAWWQVNVVCLTFFFFSRMDSAVRGVFHSAGGTAANGRLLFGGLRQAESRGENLGRASSCITPTHLVHETSTRVLFFILSQAEERQKKEAEQQEEDDEGWVKVTRGHNGAKARPHSEAANRRTLQKEIRKKKRKELINFYTWQHKNTQKERKSLIFKWHIWASVNICRIIRHSPFNRHLESGICLAIKGYSAL